MLKFKLDAAAHAALSPELQAMYEPKGDGFTLKVDGLPQGEDVTGLKAKVEELLNEKKTEKTAREQAEAAKRQADEEAARKAGDVQALELSWKQKLETTEGTYKQQLDAANKQIYSLTVGQTATSLAAELAVQGSASVLLPHLERRLSVEIVDGSPQLRVLDLQGKPSAATIDDLRQEFVSNAAFAPLITGSKASGGGAGGVKGGGAAKKFSEMSSEERTTLYRTNPAEYERLKNQG